MYYTSMFNNCQVVASKLFDKDGTKRDEKFKLSHLPGDTIKFAFSVATLGTVAIFGVAIGKGAFTESTTNLYKAIKGKHKWAFDIKDSLFTSKPPETMGKNNSNAMMEYRKQYASEAFNLHEKWIRENYVPHMIPGAGQALLANLSNESSKTVAKLSMYSKMLSDIEVLESKLSGNDASKKYMVEAQERVFDTVNKNKIKYLGNEYDSVKSALIENNSLIDKYRRELVRMVPQYEKTARMAYRDGLSPYDPVKHNAKLDEIKMNRGTIGSTLIDIGRIKWGSPIADPITGEPISFTSFNEMMLEAESKKLIDWSVDDIYSKNPTISKLNVAKIVPRIKDLVGKFETELENIYYSGSVTGNKALDKSKLYSITYELIDLGEGEVGVKVKIDATALDTLPLDKITGRRQGYTFAGDDKGKRFNVHRDINISFGNTGVMHANGQANVGKLVMTNTLKGGIHSREYVTSSWLFADSLYNTSKSIIDSIVTGDPGMANFERLIGKATSAGLKYTSISGGAGSVNDLSIIQTIKAPYIDHIGPLGERTKDITEWMTERVRVLTDDINDMQSKSVALGNVSMAEEIKWAEEERRILRLRLKSESATGRINISIDERERLVVEEGLYGYPGLNRGGDIGDIPTMSPFGGSPLSWVFNPQKQSYQQINVHQLKKESRKRSAIRWGKDGTTSVGDLSEATSRGAWI
jgi:hypothetical protein